MSEFLERDFFGSGSGGGGGGVESWVPEYDNDWTTEPAPVNLDLGAPTYTDRFGVTWDLFGNTGLWTGWTVAPGVGIRWLGPVSAYTTTGMYAPTEDIIAVGNGPAFDWHDRTLLVTQWADFSHGSGGPAFHGPVVANYSMIGADAYGVYALRGYWPGVGNEYVISALQCPFIFDWFGPAAEAMTDWYAGIENIGNGTFRVGYEHIGGAYPDDPDDFPHPFNSDGRLFILPRKRPTDADGMTATGNRIQLYSALNTGGYAYDCKLVRTTLYRWRVP